MISASDDIFVFQAGVFAAQELVNSDICISTTYVLPMFVSHVVHLCAVMRTFSLNRD